MEFMKNLEKKARKSPIKLVFPESDDERILRAASIIAKKGIARPVLLGNVKRILEKSHNLRLALKHIEIIDHLKAKNKDYLAKKYSSLRLKDGVGIKKAKMLMRNPVYYGVMLLQSNKADALISGATMPTKDTVLPALKILKNPSSFVSSFMLIIKNKRIFLFADCGLNIDPNEKELAQIAVQTAKSAVSFGIKPKIAMLSFSTQGSAHHRLVDKVRKATLIAKKLSSLPIDGEIQLDAAILPEINKKKYKNSKTKGNANILIFPDLNSGNIAYKIAERLGSAKAIGPILQNLKKPVNDLSRGCSVDDIVNLAIITALQAKK